MNTNLSQKSANELELKCKAHPKLQDTRLRPTAQTILSLISRIKRRRKKGEKESEK